MDTKLTLKLDKDVIERAKRFAKAYNTSISKMVERYLDQVTKYEADADLLELTPLVKSLYGVVELPEGQEAEESYYEYLLMKHKPLRL
jgi:hypothetical protein